MLNARLGLSVITLLVLTATVANGASTGGPSVLTGLLLLKLQNFRANSHAKRQGSNGSGLALDDFPVQCQPGCKLAVDTLNTCTQTSCLCTTPVDNSLDECINCTVTVVPDPTVIADGQKVFDTFNALCKGTGVEILSFTAATVASTSTGSTSPGGSSFSNPFLSPSTSTAITTTLPTPQGPTTTITAVTSSLSLPSNTVIGTPSTTTSPSVLGNDAVALPRASKAYAAVGLVIAFFMCLA